MSRSNSDGLPRPMSFSLAATESRAAARVILEALERGVRRVHIVIDAPRPRREGEPDTIVGPWYNCGRHSSARYSETMEQLKPCLS